MREFKAGDIVMVNVHEGIISTYKYKIQEVKSSSHNGRIYATIRNIETNYLDACYLDNLKYADNWKRIEI